MNGTINVNTTINSTHPTASYWNLEENPKYVLPLPPHGPTPHNATVEDARMALAESPSVSIAGTQSSASAKIETAPGFVKTQGQNFVLNGKAAYFAGTNAWYLAIRSMFSDDNIRTFFSVMSQNSVSLVRVFCFQDGYDLSNSPIQSSPGVWDENGLKRIDLILSQAAQYGIYVIVVPTNFEPVGGGMQWYVDQIVGSGNAKELFYTDSRVKQAYKNYVYMLLTRTNTYTGIQYKNDPTIFSFELMNEPHTTDLYEINRGWPPGQLARNWLWEMAAYIKSIDSNHLVSSGEEGYRADGPTNAPHNNWINGGYKGVDPVGNIACLNIDFLTLHIYPDNWAIGSWEFDWVNANVIRDRAQNIAHAANKPFIIEETGMKRGYLSSRDTLLNSIFGEANNDNAGATLVWDWIAWPTDDFGYSFDVWSDGSNAMHAQINYMNGKNGGALTPSAPSASSGCTNTPPSSDYSCTQQVAWHPGCSVSWLQSPYCNQECGRCSANTACNDTPPDGSYTCAQQVQWGQCNQSWMQGYCNRSCGRCTSSCTDSPPPGSAYSCPQQAGWNQCNQSWMSGYCLHSCGKC
ncbi:hypothetical protein CVIRNUC_001407 [Coccomyxa viridis]|uniref:mannan endo-1,4-beta-mannosidase n=1 Tax=Coccomyxa viridis TaxID=1274662 RepID=A0AAV1HTK0_9CHLO|nr:hypothetical protein CVIRNUC_001407 [Coccomyxa viridis]